MKIKLPKCRCRWHPAAGAAIAVAFIIEPMATGAAPWGALMGTLGLGFYQVYQDRNNRIRRKKLPDSHIDLREYLYGGIPALMTAIAIKLVLA